MPDQPADPIHYDMRVPPEPEHRDEEREPARKQEDKTDTETGNKEKAAAGEKKDRQ